MRPPSARELWPFFVRADARRRRWIARDGVVASVPPGSGVIRLLCLIVEQIPAFKKCSLARARLASCRRLAQWVGLGA